MKPLLILAAILALAACKDEDAAPPAPSLMTDEALGHYCQMFIADHPGPKAQVHLDGYQEPVWFSQVSDAIAYLHDPEKVAPISVIYVSDMAAADDWALPGASNWIAADDALFVIESRRLGGMGVPEAIPFGTKTAAEDFIATEGGRIVGWNDVPEAYVRPQFGAPAEEDPMTAPGETPHHHGAGEDVK
ncbi:nitrous oxide reductase accessory protein NosL [Rhodobacteraceae bacterium DSL-40]|uniref:nitrous oxide reductase accessory protein NosL n=1 Tax=Amaricoccus sp. B4 TaxID=3368557 RepID=UPI000DAC21D1